jgi:hypothetical protein
MNPLHEITFRNGLFIIFVTYNIGRMQIARRASISIELVYQGNSIDRRT